MGLADQLIENGQFLIGERPKLIRNGLSTDLLVFPSDKLKAHRALLEEKVNYAIDYAASFTDVERLNTLQYVPGQYKNDEDSQSRWYLTLGLYLYFSDECSRKNPANSPMTFLSALREADANLPGDKGFYPAELVAHVVGALKIAGIATDTNLSILNDWLFHGTYMIAGHHHGPAKGKGEVTGAYAQLAKQLVKEYHPRHEKGIIIGINEAISYALGNKEHMHDLQIQEELRTRQEQQERLAKQEALKSREEIEKECNAKAYAHVDETVSNTALISEHVNNGDRIRRDRIWNEIDNIRDRPLFFAANIQESERNQRQLRPVAKRILSYFPEEALEFMLRERQTVVYDDYPSIMEIFPEGKISGQSEKKTEQTREGVGVNMPRWRVMFFSNGWHEDANTVTDDVKYMRVAQSSLHELMHLAYAHMTEEEKTHLNDLVTKVSLQLWNGDTTDKPLNKNYAPFYVHFADNGNVPERTLTMDTRSLPEILDYRSTLYDGYRQTEENRGSLDTRREEVICNTFGLLHTEFRDTGSLLHTPPQALPAIGEFSQAVDDAFSKVVERLRETTSLPELPKGKGRG